MHWLETIVFLTLNVLLVAALAGSVHRFIRAAAWRRIWWQAAWVAVAGILLAESIGLSGYLSGRLFSEARPTQAEFVITTFDPNPKLNPSNPAPSTGDESQTTADPLGVKHSSPKSLGRWIGWLWLGGFLAFIIRSMVRRVLLRVFFMRSPRIDDAQLRRRALHLCSLLRLRRSPRLLECRRLRVPVAYGSLRPTVALPAGFQNQYSRGEQDVMLVHELAHLAARDPWWHAGVDLLTAVLWWHPAVWWMRSQWHRATEWAADEATSVLQEGPETLAACLVALGRKLSDQRSLGWLGVDGSPFRSGLGHRVNRLLGLRHAAWKPIGWSQAWFVKSTAPVALMALALAGSGWAKLEAASNGSWSEHWRDSLLGQVLPSATPPKVPPPQDRPAREAFAPDNAVANTPGSNPAPAEPPATDAPKPAQEPSSPTPTVADAGQSSSVHVVQEVEPWIESHQPNANRGSPSPKGPLLFTRFFKVNPETFRRNFEATQAWPSDGAAKEETDDESSQRLRKTDSKLRGLLLGAGVDISPPKSIFYNDRHGMIMMHASMNDLEIAAQLIEELGSSPAQVQILVQWCETSTLSGQPDALEQLIPLTAGPTNQAPATAILTESRFQETLAALNEASGVDLLTAPKVTTISGRGTQIKVVDVRYIVTDLDLDSDVATAKTGKRATVRPLTEPFELGPVIDIVPTVSADQTAVQLAVVATIQEFLGYDQSGEFEAYLESMETKREVAGKTPLPKFRKRLVIGSALVADGQTLVLHGGRMVVRNLVKDKIPILGDIPLAGSLFRKERQQNVVKQLAIFVTPTVIDPAGNRVRSDSGKAISISNDRGGNQDVRGDR